MSDDPRYAPPAAIVGDPVEAPQAVPQRVRRAVMLLWTSMALAVPVCALEISRNPEYGEGGVLVAMLIVYALMFAFTALLNVKVYRGRNWARVTTFVFVLIGAYFTFSPVEDSLPSSVIESVLNLFCLVLECIAVYWLFTPPGTDWFKRRK